LSVKLLTVFAILAVLWRFSVKDMKIWFLLSQIKVLTATEKTG